MDFVNPPRIFVLVDGELAPRLFGGFYRRYVDAMELDGSEDVVEFGCGSGGIAERLAPRLPRGTLTCVDISPPMVRIARRRLQRYDNTRCLEGRIDELELADASYDLIVIHNALHDVTEQDQQATVAELVRLLRPGGRLELREPTKPSHGMAPSAYRQLLTGGGMTELRSKEYKVFPIGPVFDACFAKQ